MTPRRAPRRNTAAYLACALLAAGACRPAEAEPPPLADPTRPPGLAQPSGGAARAGVSAEAPAWPQLQSVLVSAQGGVSALVDGRLVRIGERVGGLTVVAIDAQGILLRAARYEQRITLVPGVAKTASATAPPSPRTAAAAKEYR